jgi:hypothetical protein
MKKSVHSRDVDNIGEEEDNSNKRPKLKGQKQAKFMRRLTCALEHQHHYPRAAYLYQSDESITGVLIKREICTGVESRDGRAFMLWNG